MSTTKISGAPVPGPLELKGAMKMKEGGRQEREERREMGCMKYSNTKSWLRHCSSIILYTASVTGSIRPLYALLLVDIAVQYRILRINVLKIIFRH
jgi:hypothetical protein